MSTRLSKECCLNVAETGAPTKLYQFIPTCNRSLPHVELLHMILKTLCNVSQHENCFNSVASTVAIDVLLTLLVHFRDKDQIAETAIFLLRRIISSNARFKARCSTRENLKALKGIYSLCSTRAARRSGATSSYRSTKSNSPSSNKILHGLKHIINYCTERNENI